MYRPPKRKNPARSITTILNLVMGAIYLACGLYLLLSERAVRMVPRPYILPVGSAIFLYGLFRAYRSYWVFKQPNSL